MKINEINLAQSHSLNTKYNKNYDGKFGENPTDKIILDVPLFIRMLEYAKEDAKTDMDLHKVTENALSLSREGKTLTMEDYNTIVNTSESLQEIRRMQKLANI